MNWDTFTDLIRRVFGQKVRLIRLEDSPLVLMHFDRALPFSVEDACDRSWERNR